METNKAAEEDGLPELPEPVTRGFESFTEKAGYFEHFDTEQMQDYARAAIAADRASRQAANKAEVEPVSYAWVYECLEPCTDAKVWHELFAHDEPVVGKRVRNVRPLYATPPATTGASIDTPEFQEMMAEWFNQDDAETAYSGIHWKRIVDHINKRNVVGASTVLTIDTPEFRERLRGLGATFSAHGDAYKLLVGYVNRRHSVAAQAGQVAVPKGWKLVPIVPTVEMISANGRSDYEAGRSWLAEDARTTWEAMISAAPSPAKESK